MRADLITIQQTLTPEAATVLNQSIAEATRRNHGHTTPLHVAATLLSSSSGFLRQACIKSHPNSSHPLQCRALELCFSVALERLPTTTTTTSSPSQPQEPPLLSNALTAALKRAQAHQRRGCPEQQQQPLLAVKVELEQLIISILDDPSVSRVMREASFSSPAVKSAIEQSRFGNSRTVNQSAIGFGYRPVPVPVNRNPYLNPRFQQNEHSGQRSTDEEAKRVVEIMTRTRKRNPVLVGDSEPRVIVKKILGKIENGDGPLRNFQVIRLEEELASSSTRFGEISGLVETRLGNSELTGGVVLDLGDLKWLAANGGGGGAVVEMRKLLERYKGRLCFIGTATCETYLRCQVYYPSMENDCDLQAIPIAAKSPLPTMFQRFGSSNIISTESISPTRSLQIPTGKMNCCYQCLQSYENDVVKLEKSLTEHNRSVLPQWLQNAKADDTKDQEIVELQKKWNDLCLRLHPKPNSRSDITPPGSPVGTDLVLGRSNRVVSSPDKKTRDSFDIDLFKKLLKGLAKSVWWQHDAASSVASAITERKHGNGKPKGDIWLMFTGPDKTGKTKMASAIADLVSGSRPITISLGSGSSTDDGSSLRGKTALDRLAETGRRNPFAVIVMEDIDEADVLLRNNVELAMERGRICDSYGREVSLGNVIIILTVNSSLGLAENAAPIEEARLESLVSKGWKLRLSVSKTRKRKPNRLCSDQAKQRKEICFDLNEEAAEFDSSSDVTVEHDQDDDSSFVHKLVALADDAIVFRPVDFGLIKSMTAESLKKRFSNILTVEIEDDALERIAGAVWLSKISLEEWLDEAMGSSLNSVKSRVPSVEDSVVRIELEDDVNDRVSGGYLPSSVRTLVV
ncbi:PREDICTED: chaperone protein ClpB1-like isoform X2 [Brassica oleracea var. oleracea]|uniref:chaperone protein ClpB1-like isoform X2 n=1 Tax=Brassica oleracea var. oleracea TaxID=109376 RepID=UPI0006A6FDA1|nr:PREDICTED: chaperone protein ClpB1-like isoform X2 [Brassica oleracea var. oleracea]